MCGNACTPSHAAPQCTRGSCDRGVCAPGYFDLDGNRANGCEASCAGASCSLPGGATLALSAPPIPETGQVAWTFASSAPEDLAVAPDAPVAVMGEATPIRYSDPAGPPPGPFTSSNLVQNQVGYPSFVVP